MQFLFGFQHYEQDADGLCTQLTKSLPKVGKQDVCVDTKAFIKAGWVIQEHELEVIQFFPLFAYKPIKFGLFSFPSATGFFPQPSLKYQKLITIVYKFSADLEII